MRVPKDYVCGHANAICLPELICYHVRGYDAHRRADGNGCAPFRHAYANVYASECMSLSPPVLKVKWRSHEPIEKIHDRIYTIKLLPIVELSKIISARVLPRDSELR